MPQLYRFWVGLLGSVAVLAGRPALAQCPAAAACTPGPASAAPATLAAFRMGIYNVTLGSINNTTGGYADGYKDYSCTLGTNLTVGAAAAITVRNGTVASENVRVWIDYNNDGTFASNELAFTSDAPTLLNGSYTHTGTITPPAAAVLNTKLRLRVASDYANNATAITACSTPVYSQDEDYAVTLVANANPPTAAFAPSATTTCTGCVQFADQSMGVPTSWSWDFGDGSTSTQQNPQHCYAQAGTYPVKLTATNAAGSSTTATQSITYNTSVPVAANCAGLAATGNCCGYGITLVKLGSLSNASADGSAGYQDFTCTQRTSLTVGLAYTLAIGTGSAQVYDTRAWIDYNNDGTFASSELVLQVLNTASPSASFTVPAAAVQGQPLRLRIVADGVGSNPQPCTAPQLGQVEDYTVTVQPNTNPPVAAFTSDYVAGVCSSTNTYTFTDQSTNVPTAWLWTVSPSAGVSFVNGTSATSQNPQLNFAAAGYYAVTLKASSSYGSSTTTKSNYVLVQVPCPTYCAAAGGYSATNGSSAFYITGVALTAGTGGTAFSNTSGSSVPAYTFYSSTPLLLGAGTGTQTLTVATNLTISHRTSVWIDYNRDGTFANSAAELVYNGTTNAATVSIPLTVPATLATTRMRVLIATNATTTPDPCALYYGAGEVEDYVVTPQPLAAAPTAALPALTVSPNPTADGELQLSLSDAAANGRYALTVENVVGTRLLTQPVRLSAGQPTALSLRELPAGLYLVRLTNEQGQTALRRVVRE